MTGYFVLFLSALLAATLIPFSSEALLGGMAASGDYQTGVLFLSAAIGNILGSIINWAIGRYFLHWQGRKWFPFKKQNMDHASQWFNRYGLWTLLFAWVPIIGDPLTFVAGTLRTSFLPFLVLVSIGKTLRYAVILGLITQLI